MIQKGTDGEILGFCHVYDHTLSQISNLMNSELEIAMILSCISTFHHLNAY